MKEKEPQNQSPVVPETYGRRLARVAGRTADITLRFVLGATFVVLALGPLPK